MPLVRDFTKNKRVPSFTVYSPINPEGANAVGILMSTGAVKEAASLKTAYALGKLRLFDTSLPPVSATTPKNVLVAAECTFSGYTAGGYTVTAWNEEMASGIGAQIVSPVTQINFITPEDDPPVTGTVGGFWYEDAAGVPRLVKQFDDPIPMTTDTDSIALVLADYVGNG